METVELQPKLGPHRKIWFQTFRHFGIDFMVQVFAFKINDSYDFALMVEVNGHFKSAPLDEFHFTFELLQRETRAVLVTGELSLDRMARMMETSTRSQYIGSRVWKFFNLPKDGVIIQLQEAVDLLFEGVVKKKTIDPFAV
jgi:hypothetical protein